MDPWEVVKWIAIFRLILPEALFRLCGGRVENLGELQATAVQAGLNGVMMGNFLTTLGNTPERGPRQCSRTWASTWPRSPTTAPTRGPTTARAGWSGETPDLVAAALASAEPSPPRRLRSGCGIPRPQLRFAAKRAVPPAAGRGPEQRFDHAALRTA